MIGGVALLLVLAVVFVVLRRRRANMDVAEVTPE